MTGLALTLIAHEQDAGYQVVFSWCTAHTHHRLQPLVLLLTQSHGITVVRGSHARTPFLQVFFLPTPFFSRRMIGVTLFSPQNRTPKGESRALDGDRDCSLSPS